MREFWLPRNPTPKSQEFAEALYRGVLSYKNDIDRMIQQYAENWDLKRMPAVDRNIMRMAIFEIGGKTGSAQTGPRSDRRVNAWFVCFAPFDSPRYAISVMLPNRPVNNSGGRDAAPIARKFLERYLSAE